MKPLALMFVLTFFSGEILALECERPIKRIFTGFTLTTSKIHIDHGDGYEASVVRLPYVNNDEKVVDRMLSVLLAAHLGERRVRFRYATGLDGSPATCTPTIGQAIEAVWLE